MIIRKTEEGVVTVRRRVPTMTSGKIDARGERGQGLVLVALAMTVLLGIVALAVDVGLLLHERRTVQNAVDAMVLAGAAELPDDPDLAIENANEWALKNGITAGEIQSISVTTTNVPNDTLVVELNRDFSFVFGRVMGLLETDIGAGASAMMGSPVGAGGLKPWVVTDEVEFPSRRNRWARRRCLP
jgi:Flp pilus assembly protein TadG